MTQSETETDFSVLVEGSRIGCSSSVKFLHSETGIGDSYSSKRVIPKEREFSGTRY
jgi:hypothetical protein